MEWEGEYQWQMEFKTSPAASKPPTRLVGASRDVRDAMKSLYFRIAFLMRFVAVEQRLFVFRNNIALEAMLCLLGLL